MPILPQSPITQTLTKSKLILVEGRDEESFFNALLNNLEIFSEKKHLIEIVVLGGKDNLNNELLALKNRTGFEIVQSIAIVRDSDGNKDAAFQSVKDTLRNNALPYPESNLVYSKRTSFKTGIFIMPGLIEGDMLEDLCLATVEENPLTPEINKYIASIFKIDTVTGPKNISKAKTLMFLASMPNVVSSLGIGAKKGYWNFSHSSLEPLINFINEL